MCDPVHFHKKAASTLAERELGRNAGTQTGEAANVHIWDIAKVLR
jgi:hypothetical protein